LSLLNEKYNSNIFTLIPKTTSTPRWSATFESLKAVYKSYVEILLALNDIVDDEKMPINNGIDSDLEFSKNRHARKPLQRIADNSQTALQFTRQSFCIKTYREVLDNLILEYSEVIRNIEDVKSTPKHLPSRSLSFDINDVEIVPNIKHHELPLAEI
ncbi:unnamed protein product, partial [Didymodactylos carnosus]